MPFTPYLVRFGPGSSTRSQEVKSLLPVLVQPQPHGRPSLASCHTLYPPRRATPHANNADWQCWAVSRSSELLFKPPH